MTKTQQRDVPLFTVFLSSPGDVGAERLAAIEVLSGLQRKERFVNRAALTVVAWDDPVQPTPSLLNQTPQLTVNDYKLTPSHCDLTVVIFWSRLGSLLPETHFPKQNGVAYASGTAWEIADAEEGGRPVMAFWSQAPLPRKRSADEVAQTEALDAFIETKLRAPDGSYRGAVCEFGGLEDFRRKLEQGVEQWLAQQLERAPKLVAGGSRVRGAVEMSFVAPDTKPNLPDKWVPRPEVDTLVAQLLGSGRGGKLALTSVDAKAAADMSAIPEQSSTVRAALSGGGGRGKTSLAIAACHDPRIVKHFSDGILWITFGQTPDVPSLLQGNLRSLAGTDLILGELEAESTWRKLLADKRLLLVLDDVWEASALRPFLVPTRGAYLFTTRIRSLSEEVGATELPIERMPVGPAAGLLMQWLPESSRDPRNISVFAPLVTSLDGWPLLLKLVGAFLGQQVKHGRTLQAAIATAQARLETRGPADFRSGELSAKARERSVEECVFACFGQGGDVEHDADAGLGGLRARFEELGVFAEDADIPLATVARLWQRTAQLDRFAAEAVLLRLNDFALFDRFDLQAGQEYLRLHDVIRSLLQKKRGPRLPALHGDLLDSYAVSHFADLPRSDSYIFTHLAAHVTVARGRDALRSLLREPGWLRAKLLVQGFDALLADFRLLGVRDRMHVTSNLGEPADAVTQTLFESLWLSAPALRRNPDELEVQLLGRLAGDDDELRALCETLSTHLPSTALCPRRPTLDRAGGALLTTLVGHVSTVNGALLLPDAVRALSWSVDKTLKLWDLHSGQCVQTLEGHAQSRWVTDALLLPDAGRALSWSVDKALKLWNLQGGQCIHTLEGHADSVYGALLLPDAGRALSWSRDTTLMLWDLRGGCCVQTLEGHADSVYGALLLPDAGRALSWSADKTLKLWDMHSGQCVQTLEGHASSVKGALLLPDATRALSWGGDTTLKLWDLYSGQCVQTLEGHAASVRDVLLLPGAGRALSWSEDNTLKLWDLYSGQCVQTLEGHADRVIGALLLPDAARALSWSIDKTLKLWDLHSGQCVQTLEGHAASVRNVLLLPDATRALSWSEDNTLKLWDMYRGQCVQTLEGHADWVIGALLLPDAGRVLSWSIDKTLKLWDLRGGQRVQASEGHADCVTGAHMLPDARRALSWSEDNTLKLWDVHSGQCLQTLEGHADWVIGAHMLPDAGRALSWSEDNTLKLWDVHSGQCLQTLEGHARCVKGALVHTDATRALSWSDDKTLKVWDMHSGQCLQTLEGHARWVKGALLLPDAARALSWSADKTLKLWDVHSGQCVQTLEGHADWVTGALLLSDAARALSWSADRTLKVWDVQRGQCVQTLEGHAAPVLDAVLLPDAARALSWSADKTLKLWDVHSGQCVQTLEGHADSVRNVLLLPDAPRALSWGKDNALMLWSLTEGRRVASWTLDASPTTLLLSTPSTLLVGDARGGVHFLEIRER